MKSLKSKQRGFTLIELLVVIAIIGLLAAILYSNISTARLRARNTKRIAETLQLTKAFNYSIDSGSQIPDTSGATQADGGSSSGWVCISSSCTVYLNYPPITAFLGTYLPQYPNDPLAPGGFTDGYLFNGNFVGGTGPLGNYVPPGPMIQYLLETQSPINCGPGIPWKINAGGTICRIPIN